MPFRMTKPLACSLVAAALFATGAARADLVTNGDFETGDFSGWTTAIDPLYDAVDTLMPQAGTYAAYFGGADSSISQSLATVAGTTYKISFWLQLEADVTGAAAPNTFGVNFGSFAGPTFMDATDFGYTHIEFLATAASASTNLAFNFKQGPAFWDLDSIQVNAVDVVAAIPEPASLALLAAAGLGWVGAKRRRPSASPSA